MLEIQAFYHLQRLHHIPTQMSDIDKLSTAFKHINVYEVLEPQKVHNVQVATLVDISDDKSKPNEELIGSFIDKVTKSKFDILDVYENIYVTPQHLEPQRKNDLDLDIFIREDKSNDEVDSVCDNASANIRKEANNPRDIKVDSSISQISFPKLHRLDKKSICTGFIDDILKPKVNLNDNVNKTSAAINESICNVDKLDRDQNLPTSNLKTNLKWGTEQSDLTLGSLIPSAYPATCRIQREADLNTIQSQNFTISTKENKDMSNNLFGNEVKDDLKYDYFKPNLTLNQNSFDLAIASDVPHCKRIQEIQKKQDNLTFFNKTIQQNIQSQNCKSTKEINKYPKNYLSVLSNEMSGEQFSQSKINFNIENCAASKISTVNEKPVYKTEKPVLESKSEDRNALFFKKFQDLLNQPSQDLKTAENTKLNLSKPKAKVDLKYIHIPQKLTEKNNFLINLYQYNIKSTLIDGNKVIKSLNYPPIPVLQTIQLNKKLFAKRLISTENEKIRYTKGPDIYEKSLILPQIMERLMIKNKNEAAKKNLTRKYILDYQNNGGSNSAFVMPELVTEVVIEDCNKERLKALKVRKAFEEFVKGKA